MRFQRLVRPSSPSFRSPRPGDLQQPMWSLRTCGSRSACRGKKSENELLSRRMPHAGRTAFDRRLCKASTAPTSHGTVVVCLSSCCDIAKAVAEFAARKSSRPCRLDMRAPRCCYLAPESMRWPLSWTANVQEGRLAEGVYSGGGRWAAGSGAPRMCSGVATASLRECSRPSHDTAMLARRAHTRLSDSGKVDDLLINV